MINHSLKYKCLPVIVVLVVALLFQTKAAATEPQATPPDNMSYVSDLANALSAETEQSLAQQSAALEELTGAQFAVVTMEFLGGETIKDYADMLFNRWQLGDSNKNNGLLLLLATGEDNYYVLQGKGLENSLSNAQLNAILQQNLEPDFSTGNYESGVQKTYDVLLNQLEHIYGVGNEGVLAAAAQAEAEKIAIEQADNRKKELLRAAGVVVLLLLIVVLIVVVKARNSRHRKRRVVRSSRQRLNGR